MRPLNKDSDPVLYFEHSTASNHVIAHARLNVESTLNSLSLDMIESLSTMIDHWRQRDDIVALIFSGAGDRAFCAGGDIQALYHAIKENHASGSLVNSYPFDFFEREYRLDFQIHTFPKPVIAIGHGVVMGGGLGIFSAADYRVVTERSRVAMPEVTIGLFPDAGQTWLLRNMEPHYAIFLGVTGSHINAADALEIGLGTHSLDSDARSQLIDDLCASDFSSDINETIDAVLLDLPMASLPDKQIDRIPENLSVAKAPSEVVLDIKNLQGESEWIDRGISAMEGGCPTTIGITLEQIKRSYDMSLAEVFQMEIVIGTHCANNEDFMEGVRALLIEKDNNPSWKYKNMNDLPVSYVQGHFKDPWVGIPNPLSDLGE